MMSREVRLKKSLVSRVIDAAKAETAKDEQKQEQVQAQTPVPDSAIQVTKEEFETSLKATQEAHGIAPQPTVDPELKALFDATPLALSPVPELWFEGTGGMLFIPSIEHISGVGKTPDGRHVFIADTGRTGIQFQYPTEHEAETARRALAQAVADYYK